MNFMNRLRRRVEVEDAEEPQNDNRVDEEGSEESEDEVEDEVESEEESEESEDEVEDEIEREEVEDEVESKGDDLKGEEEKVVVELEESDVGAEEVDHFPDLLERIVTLTTGSKNITTSAGTLKELYYFGNLMTNFPDQGTEENPYFIDLDHRCLYNMVEHLRSGNLRPLSKSYQDIFDQYKKKETADPLSSETSHHGDSTLVVTLNVGGTVFKTTKSTLSTSIFFKNIFKELDQIPAEDAPKSLFIDRDPIAFEQILSYLRNPQIHLPDNLLPELLYFQIEKADLKPTPHFFEGGDGDTPLPFYRPEEEEEEGPEGGQYFKDLDTGGGDIMAGGGIALLQLVAYGAQDINITGNPKFTFFKNRKNLEGISSYKRHTNFAADFIEQTANSQPDFGRTVTYCISKIGDLMHKSFFALKINEIGQHAWKSPEHLVYQMIESIELEIGGNRIDVLQGELIYMLQQMYHKSEYDLLIKKYGNRYLILPLYFFFNLNSQHSIPLIALSYHEVKLRVRFRPVQELLQNNAQIQHPLPSVDSSTLMVQYIYLDKDERRDYARENGEYLIHQHQYMGAESFNSPNYRMRLNFCHPVSQLLFTIHDDRNQHDPMDYFYYSNDQDLKTAQKSPAKRQQIGLDPLISAKLIFNDHDRLTLTPELNIINNLHGKCSPDQPIYLISFALNSGDFSQPSGSANFSRIDNATINFRLRPNSGTIKLWAINYNFLRTASGMAGMTYVG